MIENLESQQLSGPSRRSGLAFLLAGATLLIIFTGQLVFHAVRTSVTLDEPVHILAGHRHLQCGDFGINPEHPPLLKLIAAAPLSFRTLKEPPWECGSKLTSKFDSFSYGNTFLVENGVDSVVIPTRLAAALMSVFLAMLVFFAAWEMFGRWEAITALAIFAFEPSLIGHGSVVTTDMAISAGAFAAMYALYRYAKDPGWSRFVVAGLAFGLMLAVKHSAVIFLPALFLVFAVDTAVYQRATEFVRTRLARNIPAFAGALIIGLILLWSLYGFRYYAIPSATEDTISIGKYIRDNARPETIEGFPARVTEAIGKTYLLPESYILGMADVIAWGNRNTTLFGKNYPTGHPFYFPVVVAVKSSLAVLILLPLALLLPFLYRTKRREALYLLTPALFYFVVASTSPFTTGVRHILPIYAFLIVASAAGAVWLSRKIAFVRYLLAALLIFNAIAAVRTAPNYLAFANDLWGGYENTHRVFGDGNVNTGQNLKLIAEYIERENVGECWLVNYVHPELAREIQPCHMMPSNLRPMVSRNPIEPIPPIAEGTFFVSINDLPPRGGDEYIPFTKSEPLAFIGGNTYVYRGRFEIPLVAAMSHSHRSGAFLRAGRFDEAMAEARTAVGLGPEDPRPHLALGRAFARTGDTEHARAELNMTLEFAKRDSRFRNEEVWAIQELGRLDAK